MIKKIAILFLGIVATLGISNASSKYTYDILGVTYSVDTLFHAQVGPGTTQTSLVFKGPTYDLRVFYLTIDLMNPNVSIRAVCGQDRVAGTETVRSMATRNSKDGKLYYAGVNGDFFSTSGTTLRGSSIVGTPTNSCIVNGEFYKTSNSSKQFCMDVNGVPFVGQANYYSGTATCGDNKVLFKGVNLNSPNQGITIYTPRYYAGTNQSSTCAEVTAKLVDGETFAPGKTCKMIVTSLPSTTGDTTIPSDGFVIHGRGSIVDGTTIGAYDFVNSLKVGDVVTLNSKVLIDGTDVVPYQMVSGNPRTVGDGLTLDTESERGDASAFHPRTGIGYGANKSKVIMMVIDGRSAISNGVRTSQEADLMRYAGATDAINLDGGGSSTLYTSALGIRNVPSDGSERSDGNGIFAVSNAPEDNTIAEIRFVDWAMQFPKYGTYVPKFYGYNQYGMLINTDVQGVTLSCATELGHIKNGNTFVGDGNGTHALTATYNGKTAIIPVTITAPEDIKMRLAEVINDTYRDYTVEVQGKMGENYLILDPSALTWSSADENLVKIDSQSGVLRGVADGTTTITGVVGSLSSSLNIKVEKPLKRTQSIDPAPDTETWKVTQTGGTNMVKTAVGDGMKLTYTGNGVARGANIKLSKEVYLWSLPDTMRIRINPHSAPLKSITFGMRPNGGNITPKTATALSAITADQETVFDLATSDWCDVNDMTNYPLKLEYIQMTMGTSTTGTEYQMDINGIETVYKAVPKEASGIGEISNDFGRLQRNPINMGESAIYRLNSNGVVFVTIADMSGRIVAKKSVEADGMQLALPTSDLSRGYYLVTVDDGMYKGASKLIIK